MQRGNLSFVLYEGIGQFVRVKKIELHRILLLLLIQVIANSNSNSSEELAEHETQANREMTIHYCK